MSDSFFLVLGDQLFASRHYPVSKKIPIFMAEDHGLCTHFKYHKNKLIFFLASMREYRDSLEKKGIHVHYYGMDHPLFKKDFFSKLDDFVNKHKKLKKIHYYQVSDSFFEKKLKKWIKKNKLEHEEHNNPMFLTSRGQFEEYLNESKRPFMMNFYNRQRKRLDLLMDRDGKPEGGKWSFDTENRKKYPKNIEFPEMPVFRETKNITEIKSLVVKNFSKHPGTTENFWLPVNRRQALKWLDGFIAERFANFGSYEDAIRSDNAFGFHSALSPMINSGLLTPDEIVDKIVEAYNTNDAPLASVEGFVRQIIGWREFVKGIYDNYADKMENDNYWGHQRLLSKAWYKGDTGLPPFDDSVKRLQKYGYAHHIERLMIQSNLMLLCEVHPQQVYQWFMEMYVDSADWVMAANVYGMGQMSEGGIFATKPYICGSNYIIKMSDYKKGDWCDTMDGLYWRFIDKHKKVFAANQRMSMMAKMVEKLDPKRKKKIFKKAEDFIAEYTHLEN